MELQLKVIFLILYVVLTLAFPEISNNNRCADGPYYYEIITDRWREGLGQVSSHMSLGLFVSKVFKLNYILNPIWFDSEHNSSYEKMFDFNNKDCTFEDVHREYANTTHSTLKIVNISSHVSRRLNDMCTAGVLKEHYDDMDFNVLNKTIWKGNDVGLLEDLFRKWHLRDRKTVFVAYRFHSSL